MKPKYCIPCKIEGKRVYGEAIIDGMLMCKHHVQVYKKLNLEEDEEFED